MARRNTLFGKARKRIERVTRSGMNRVTRAVNEFEDRGGVRGAFERTRVRTERQATRLLDMLEDRGIEVEFGRFIPPTNAERAELRAHYRTLGVPYGASLETVKTAYRAKMREHHPDRHTDDPSREREATRISQDVTIAYDAIEAHLRVRG